MSIYDNLELLPLDLQGWGGTDPFFEQIITEVRPSIIAEVGTWKGQSAVHMAGITKRMNIPTKIYCIDTWLGGKEHWFNGTENGGMTHKNGYPQVYFQFLSNVVHSSVQDIIVPVPTTSLIGARYLKEKNIHPQLIYVDASHDYDDVYIDVREYFEACAPGGVIFGHDYFHDDVRNAVTDFSRKIGKNLESYNNTFWIMRK